MPTVNARDYYFVYSLNKQSAIGTAIINDNLNKMRSVRGFAPLTKEGQFVSDRAWYGKGHPWATFYDEISKRHVIAAQERSATDLDCLYAAAFVMGDVLSTIPDSSGYPTEHLHTITWQSTVDNKEVIYTTVGEAMGDEYKKVLSGAWINSFTLTGDRADHVRISFEGGGRKYMNGTFTVPELTAASFFKTLFGTVAFGEAASVGDISAEVLSWNLVINQNAQPMYLMGNAAGEEKLISEVLIGQQTVSGSVVIKVNADHRDLFLTNETCGLQIVCKSPDKASDNGHQKYMQIDIPNLVIASEAFGTEGDTVSYTMNISEEATLKGEDAEHLEIAILTNIGIDELLIAA